MSMEAKAASQRGGPRWRLISLAIAAVGLAVLIGANAHLIYVAFSSQPDCVPHVKQAGEAGRYRAAGSAC